MNFIKISRKDKNNVHLSKEKLFSLYLYWHQGQICHYGTLYYFIYIVVDIEYYFLFENIFTGRKVIIVILILSVAVVVLKFSDVHLLRQQSLIRDSHDSYSWFYELSFGHSARHIENKAFPRYNFVLLPFNTERAGVVVAGGYFLFDHPHEVS